MQQLDTGCLTLFEKKLPTSSLAPTYKLCLPTKVIADQLQQYLSRDFVIFDWCLSRCWNSAIVSRNTRSRREYFLKGWKSMALAHSLAPGDRVEFGILPDMQLRMRVTSRATRADNAPSTEIKSVTDCPTSTSDPPESDSAAEATDDLSPELLRTVSAADSSCQDDIRKSLAAFKEEAPYELQTAPLGMPISCMADTTGSDLDTLCMEDDAVPQLGPGTDEYRSLDYYLFMYEAEMTQRVHIMRSLASGREGLAAILQARDMRMQEVYMCT